MVATVALIVPGMANANAIVDAVSFFTSIQDMLIGAFLILLSMLVFNVVTVVLLIQAALGDVMMNIGLAFGPLLIAFYPIVPSFTNGLISFLATSVALKAVAAFVVGLGVQAAQGAATAMLNARVAELSVTATSVMMMFIMLMLFIGFVALKVPRITEAMLGGALLSFGLPMPRGGLNRGGGAASSRSGGTGSAATAGSGGGKPSPAQAPAAAKPSFSVPAAALPGAGGGKSGGGGLLSQAGGPGGSGNIYDSTSRRV